MDISEGSEPKPFLNEFKSKRSVAVPLLFATKALGQKIVIEKYDLKPYTYLNSASTACVSGLSLPRRVKMEWNLVVGDLETEWNLVYRDTKMVWNLLLGTPKLSEISILKIFELIFFGLFWSKKLSVSWVASAQLKLYWSWFGLVKLVLWTPDRNPCRNRSTAHCIHLRLRSWHQLLTVNYCLYNTYCICATYCYFMSSTFYLLLPPVAYSNLLLLTVTYCYLLSA